MHALTQTDVRSYTRRHDEHLHTYIPPTSHLHPTTGESRPLTRRVTKMAYEAIHLVPVNKAAVILIKLAKQSAQGLLPHLSVLRFEPHAVRRTLLTVPDAPPADRAYGHAPAELQISSIDTCFEISKVGRTSHGLTSPISTVPAAFEIWEAILMADFFIILLWAASF